MIIDLQKFIASEKPDWVELEEMLARIEDHPSTKLSLRQLERFYYLYQRASEDLAKIITFSAESNIRTYLESIIARAYAEIHENRGGSERFNFRKWFFTSFPGTFRRHIRAFWIALAAMCLGCTAGAWILFANPTARDVLLPFSHLQDHPSDRVAREESRTEDQLAGGKAAFSSYLMTHNTRVSMFTLALGITWGIGSVIMLFYNGVILGAVALDYVMAHETRFLLGWLLPHGMVEIPAILLAGQAGLVLAGAMIGWNSSVSIRQRLRSIAPDLVTLIGGVFLMLVWAGMVEAFFSQYHEPVIRYEFKIGLGVMELILLLLFFSRAGRPKPESLSAEPADSTP